MSEASEGSSESSEAVPVCEPSEGSSDPSDGVLVKGALELSGSPGRATMTIGDRIVALSAIAFINAAFALFVPWLAVLGLVASVPMTVAILHW